MKFGCYTNFKKANGLVSSTDLPFIQATNATSVPGLGLQCTVTVFPNDCPPGPKLPRPISTIMGPVPQQPDCSKSQSQSVNEQFEAELAAAASRMRLDYIMCLWPRRSCKDSIVDTKSKIPIKTNTSVELFNGPMHSIDQPDPCDEDTMRSKFSTIPFDWAGKILIAHVQALKIVLTFYLAMSSKQK